MAPAACSPKMLLFLRGRRASQLSFSERLTNQIIPSHVFGSRHSVTDPSPYSVLFLPQLFFVSARLYRLRTIGGWVRGLGHRSVSSFTHLFNHGVSDLSGAQVAHSPAFDAFEAMPAQGYAAPFPQWILHRLVRFHWCWIPQVRDLRYEQAGTPP